MAPGIQARSLLTDAQLSLRGTLKVWYGGSVFPEGVLPQLSAFAVACIVVCVVYLGSTQDFFPVGNSDQPAVKTQVENFSRQLKDGSVERRTTILRTTRIGLPLEELERAVATLQGNDEKAALSEQLLDELGATAEAPSRSKALQQFIWRTWFFHEDAAVLGLVETGTELMQAGELPAAEHVFLFAVRADPSYAEAWNKLATVHYYMHEYESSLADIDSVLALEPRHFGALHGRGLVQLALHHPEDAKVSFEEASEVSPWQVPPQKIAASSDEIWAVNYNGP